MNKEQKFHAALKDVFVGAKIEGESGYINLMKIKSAYFEKVLAHLKKDVDESLKKFPGFREELFDKLYTFFNRYFSESGSIYFSYTPVHQNVYEKVYTDDKDVMLFWKTNMLYYVKTDRIFKNLEVEEGGFKFFFDVSKLEYKKANEKKNIIYELRERRKDGTLVFNVHYSEKGKITKIEDIVRELKKEKVGIDEETVENGFKIFEKQNEVDYFINKNAKEFLKEQLNIWLYQYVFTGESEWTETRIKQLQTLKSLANRIIDFISQFEDELIKIWDKPKFVLNSNYVITLDRIADRNTELVKKILSHKNFPEQVVEWKELGIIDKGFSKGEVIKKNPTGYVISREYQYLPIDTKYFKDLELEILGLFENLDESLDGWLIKSENYQALNTILPKFKGRVQTIYIDPPFNTGNDFDYVDNFQNSTWLTLMDNRLKLAKQIMNQSGSFYLHLDENANYLGRLLMDNNFGKDNFQREIIWDIQVLSGFKVKGAENRWILGHQTIYFYTKSDKFYFEKLLQPQSLKYLESFNKTDEKGFKYQVAHGRRIYKHEVEKKGKPFGDVWADLKDIIDVERPFLDVWKELSAAVDFDKPMRSVWSDIMSFQQQPTSSERVDFDTQKPEKLLERVIRSSTKEGQIVLDYYGGSGTTVATAQKTRRKWITIEMADYFYSRILPRCKKTISGHVTVISKENKYEGGGFFKYYELEQYEDALRRVKYEDSSLFEKPGEDPYSQYVFMRDVKMLDALEVDYKNNKVRVDLSNLYKNVDIAETLSNVLGRWIKKLTPDFVEFDNGDRIAFKDLDYKLIKPLVWW